MVPRRSPLPHPRRRAGLLTAVAVGLAAALAGCGGGQEEDGAATDPGSQTGATATPRASEGREVYLRAGCDQCHGEDARGSRTAPGLPGHSRKQVRQMVRSPVGTMPAYPPSRMSDEDLEHLAEYIASLPEPERHVEPIDLEEAVASHHWLALNALAAENRAEALHHVDHILDVVRGRQHERMGRVRGLIEAGRLHDAEHQVEDMLAGEADPGLSRARLHLRLALSAAEAAETAQVRHHLVHFRDLVSGAEASTARELLAALRAGEMHEVEDGIRRLLGLPHAHD